MIGTFFFFAFFKCFSFFTINHICALWYIWLPLFCWLMNSSIYLLSAVHVIFDYIFNYQICRCMEGELHGRTQLIGSERRTPGRMPWTLNGRLYWGFVLKMLVMTCRELHPLPPLPPQPPTSHPQVKLASRVMQRETHWYVCLSDLRLLTF